MERELKMQAAALIAALVLGAAAGLGYDIFRMLRRSAGAPAGAALDALYCALVGIALFLFAASAPVGGLGIWELGMALLGFLLYMHHFSRFAQPPLTALACAADAFRARVMGAAKKYSLRAIFLFQKVKGCFIIKKRAPDDVREGSDAEP